MVRRTRLSKSGVPYGVAVKRLSRVGFTDAFTLSSILAAVYDVPKEKTVDDLVHERVKSKVHLRRF